MIFPKITLQPLASVALSTGLIFSNALTPASATEILNAALDLAPPVEQKSLVGRVLSISAGALTGVVIYSFVTGDWGWTLLTMENITTGTVPVASAAGVAEVLPGLPGAATAGTAATGTTAVVAEVLPGLPVAAVVTPPPASAVVGTTGGAVATAATAWASRWGLVTASGLTGAFLGNAIYSSR